MPQRLVVFAPNWLGDAVMALPAIADLHRAAPAAGMAVAARPSIAPLFRLVPHVSEIVVLEKDGRAGAALSGFDTALLLPNSFESALLARRAGIRERWGYRADWRGGLLTRAIERPSAGVHQVDYYQRLVRALGFANGPPEPQLTLREDARAAGADLLGSAGWDRRAGLVAIAPGAAYGGAKRWPSAFFARVARGLADDGLGCVLVGSAGDAPAAREIEAQAGAGGHLFNLIGATDLPALAGVLANCRALICNDSGAMHVAAAIGVRVVALFGPTNEQATGPRGDAGPDAHTVLIHPVWCRPCMLRECPLDHRCMSGIGPDDVLAEVRRPS